MQTIEQIGKGPLDYMEGVNWKKPDLKLAQVFEIFEKVTAIFDSKLPNCLKCKRFLNHEMQIEEGQNLQHTTWYRVSSRAVKGCQRLIRQLAEERNDHRR